MSFFDQKQEVMDVKLTQFGKELLSRGVFRPAYYQFFDDNILYDASYANITETQNDAEVRILDETPRLKTIHLTFPVEERYSIEEKKIELGEMDRFKVLRRHAAPDIQERILLYPMATQEVQNQNIAKFDLLALEAPIISVKQPQASEDGIQKNVPIIKMQPKYRLIEERENLSQNQNQAVQTREDFIDLMSEEIIFSDNSKLVTKSENIVIDVEELNCFDGLGNFYLNIYEVSQNDENQEKVFKKLDSMEAANIFFNIKKDKEIQKYAASDPESRNHHKRGSN